MRLLVKTLTYRALAFLVTGTLAFLVTGDFLIAAGAAGAELFGKLVLYYLFEHGWRRWGTTLMRIVRLPKDQTRMAENLSCFVQGREFGRP